MTAARDDATIRLMSPTGPILICFDGSASSRHAMVAARETLADQPAVLLHVWTAPAAVLADAFSTRGGGPDQAVLEAAAVRRAGQVAAQGVQLASELGIEAKVREVRSTDHIAGTVLAVADELDARMIVVGTHGIAAEDDTLLGSVSHALLRDSRRPVLVVPSGNP